MHLIHSKLLSIVFAVTILSLSSTFGTSMVVDNHNEVTSMSMASSNSGTGVRVGAEPAPSNLGVRPTNGSGSSWTYLTQAAVLQDPTEGTMTYDAADGYVLWYGGDCGGFGCNQTAAFQNGSWRNIQTAVSPTAQKDAPMVYDAAEGYVLLQGGWGYNCFAYSEYECNETWEYKAGVWTQLDPRCYYLGSGYGNCSLPEGYHPMVYDSASGEVFLDGGYLGGASGVSSNGDNGPWVFSNDTWTYLGHNFSSGQTISNPNAPSLVYDVADGYIMAFGGLNPYASLPGNVGDNFTWEWNDNNWTNITANVSNAPPGRTTTSMTYDATGGYVLLYGGTTSLCMENVSFSDCEGRSAVSISYADTWRYVGGNWSELDSSSAPGYAIEPLLAYDPVDRGVVDYNEASCGNANITTDCTNESHEATWLWGPAAPIGNLSVHARNAVDVGVSMNLSVTFDGGTAPFMIQWAFGDGQYASGRSVAHTYSTPGNLTVVVWVNDSQGYHAVSLTNIAVYAKSLATAYAYPSPTDVGLGATFLPGILNGSPAQYSFNWSFGDGESATYLCPNPCGPEQDGTFHTYRTSGVYPVVVAITYFNGAVARDAFSIQVNPNPALQSLDAAPDPAILDQPVNFTALVTGGTAPFTYAWSFGDGGTGGNLSDITHIYTTDGPFQAVVQVSDEAGYHLSSSLDVTIALNASIAGNVSLGAAPLFTSFESRVSGGVPGYTYLWQFGDGTTSTSPEPAHVYARPGVYIASLLVEDAAGQTDAAHWSLEAFPGGGDISLEIQASATSLSVGESTTLTLSPSGGVGAYTLSWSTVPSGCAIVSSLVLGCDPTTNGTFTAGARVTDGPGATASSNLTFTVGKLTTPTPAGGSGKGILGLTGSDGVFLVLGLAGGALVGIGSAVAINRRRHSPASGHETGGSPSGTGSGGPVSPSGSREDSEDHLRDLF
jgi:PKD repeat protein